MLETPHVALAAAIAVAVPNPLISIPLAFASHFILDMTPHWNPHFYTETKKYGQPLKSSTIIAVTDETIAIFLTLFIAYNFLPNVNQALSIMFCSVASVLPDQIKFPFFFMKSMRLGILKKWVDFERSIQVEVSPFWGIITQFMVIIASIFYVFTNH